MDYQVEEHTSFNLVIDGDQEITLLEVSFDELSETLGAVCRRAADIARGSLPAGMVARSLRFDADLAAQAANDAFAIIDALPGNKAEHLTPLPDGLGISVRRELKPAA